MKTPFKALIVDDERLARRDLMSMLVEYDSIEVVAEADNVQTALKAIADHKPDLIFLDIQMPGESGFDLVEKLTEKLHIIFVTAYDEHAIRAFEVNALDYLLKPVNPERLANTIERLETEVHHDAPMLRELNHDDRLFLMIDDRMVFLKISDIIYIQAAGDYSELFLRNKSCGLTTKTMKEWEYRLPDNYFCRIHRSTIINMEYVDRLEEWFNYSYKVHMKGIKEPLAMSRRFVAKLKEKLG